MPGPCFDLSPSFLMAFKTFIGEMESSFPVLMMDLVESSMTLDLILSKVALSAQFLASHLSHI